MIKFFYKKKIFYYACIIPILLVLGVFTAHAQTTPTTGAQVTVSGIVKDATGPLPGASVLLAGSSSGISTNTSGAFTIKVETGKSISVRMLGYLPQTIKITEAKSDLIIVLKTDQQTLKDVVVIGYQQVSRRTISAAVTSIDPKSIADIPAPTFDALLQGRVAGLNVQNFSGEPGVRSNVVLRGNTAVSRNIDNNTGSASGKASLARAISGPLYVIDGVPQSTEDLAAINYGSGTSTDVLAGIPIGDIENIDILKDASAAAVYGSRGANGVIIITTKKGVAGKTRINFSTYHGITDRPNLDKVLTGAEETRAKLALLQHYGNYDNLKNIPQILTDTLNPAFNNANDYRGQLYQTGVVDNYQLSLTGGNDIVTYRYGLNYYNESGIIKKTGLQRYSINSTVGINVSPRLKISTQIRFYRVDRPTSLSDISGNVNPFTGGYYANSPLPPSNLYLTQDNKNFLFVNTTNASDNNTNNSITISPTIDWKISNHFSFNSVISYESAGSRKDTFTPGIVRQSGYGYASSFVDNSANYLFSSNFQYSTTLNKVHHINVLLGQNTEYHSYRATSAAADGIPNDQISIVKVLDKNSSTAFSDLIESGIATEFLRVNYDFKGRYLLSGVMNADASSKFGPGNRVGYFPSVSAGWIVSDEPFMKFAKNWLTLFKLRGSYGITGRQPDGGDNYLSFNSYNIGAGGFAGSSSPQTGQNLSTTYNGVAAISPNFNGGLSNKDLTWEHSKQLNVGFDMTFLDGRFNFIADAYVKNTSKGIFTLNLPVTTGYQSIVTNSIGTQNRGLEASFIAHYFSPKSAFQWETDFNIAYNQNEITALPNGGRDIYLDKYLLRQGQPINEYNLFQQTGIYKTDKDVPINPVTGAPINFYGYPFKGGDPIWKDSNGDGTLDATDYVPAGNPNPKFTGGFNNIFGYKNWTLSVFCTFTLGRDIYNDYLVGKLSHLVPNDDGDPDPYHAITHNAFPDLSGINYWKNPGDIATYPSLSSVSGTHYKYAAVSSAWVENGSYLRVKTVSLGYTFNQGILQKLHLSRLRIYGMVDNLHIFQKSNVPDAEEVDAFGVYNGSGYPIPKKFTLGLDISL
jgi:TonB-linked SusC/RagA family outer membrane protein